MFFWFFLSSYFYHCKGGYQIDRLLVSSRLPLVALMKCLLYFAGVLFSRFVSVDFCWNCGQYGTGTSRLRAPPSVSCVTWVGRIDTLWYSVLQCHLYRLRRLTAYLFFQLHRCAD